MHQKTCVDFQEFWGVQFCLEQDVTRAAGSFGFGANAHQANEHDNATFNESVDKFAASYNATQSTINGLTAMNQQLTNMNQHLQQQLANQGIVQQQMIYQNYGQPQFYQQHMWMHTQMQQQKKKKNNGSKKNSNGWNPSSGNSQQQQATNNYTMLATCQPTS